MKNIIITEDESGALATFSSIKKAAQWHLGFEATASRIKTLGNKLRSYGETATYHRVKYTKTILNNE